MKHSKNNIKQKIVTSPHRQVFLNKESNKKGNPEGCQTNCVAESGPNE
jgi:hypothetical protein